MKKEIIKHIHLTTCHSTQDELKGKAEPGVGYLISSEKQTQGHGRHRRQWNDSTGSIAFSMTLLPHPEKTWQSLEIAVLIAQFCEQKLNEKIFVKWPNDLMTINSNKFGGILIDSIHDLMFVGIGMNIFSPIENFEFHSLKSLKIPAGDWKKQLCFDLADFIIKNSFQSSKMIKQQWENRCIHIEKNISILENNKELRGEFIGLGINGQAIIKTESGLQEIYTGTLRL